MPNSTDPAIKELKCHLASALRINKSNEENSHEAGRAKVRGSQLDCRNREKLCYLQGVGYSYDSIFVDIEPLLLPEALVLVGRKYRRDDLCRMLIAVAPDLASIIDQKGLAKQTIAKNVAMIASLDAEYARQTAKYLCETAALTARNLQLMPRLSDQKKQGSEFNSNSNTSGRKRSRSASF